MNSFVEVWSRSGREVRALTITLHGADGSHLVFHESVHVLVKANSIDLFVDNVHASC